MASYFPVDLKESFINVGGALEQYAAEVRTNKCNNNTNNYANLVYFDLLASL